MSLGLLAPMGLAALAALLVPLLIHLARREEQAPLDFAALRWLSASFRPRQRLRWDEILLLLLRLLLVATLALLLARPVLWGSAGDAPWLVVLPGADLSAAPALPEDAQRRWLAPGFPPLDADMPGGTIATASLLRQLDSELPAATPVTVLVTQTFSGADGALPQLSRRVDWRIAGEAAIETPPETTPFVLAVRHAPDRTAALPYLRAAMSAWHAGDREAIADALDIQATSSPLPASDRALVWLAPGGLPDAVLAWIRAGGTALLDAQTDWPLAQPGAPVWRDASGNTLAQASSLGRGRVVQITRAFAPAALPELAEPDFAQRLRTLIDPEPLAPTRAHAAAYRPMTGGPSFRETPRDVSPWLLWLATALFALERWVASGRREVGR